MRAAMFMRGLHPGSMSWSIYRSFVDHLAVHDVDLEVVTDAGSGPGGHNGVTPIDVSPARVDRALAPWTRSPSFAGMVHGLTRFLRARADLELLYVEIAYPQAAAAEVARRRAGWPGKLVVTPMGEDFLVVADASYGSNRFAVPRWLTGRTMARADGVRFISPMVERHFSDLNCPTAMVPLNIAPRTTAAEPGTAATRSKAAHRLRERFGVATDRTIVALSRLHPFKGLHVLVDALPEVPDATLVLAGPTTTVKGFGDYAAFLTDRARALGVEGRVVLTDKIEPDDVPAFLAGADVVAVPSLLESMNRVCAEAASVGTPFVITETTGAALLLDEEGVGVVVPPRDAASLAGALGAVLTGTWRSDGRAQTRFAERFAPAVAARDTAALLHRVVDC